MAQLTAADAAEVDRLLRQAYPAAAPPAAHVDTAAAPAALAPLGGLRERLIFDAVCGSKGSWEFTVLREELEYVEYGDSDDVQDIIDIYELPGQPPGC